MNPKHPLDMVDEPMKLFPPIDQRLLDALQSVFPPLAPFPGKHTMEEIWFRSGVQYLVRYLKGVKEWQESPDED